jgi:hypothetical protein
MACVVNPRFYTPCNYRGYFESRARQQSSHFALSDLSLASSVRYNCSKSGNLFLEAYWINKCIWRISLTRFVLTRQIILTTMRSYPDIDRQCHLTTESQRKVISHTWISWFITLIIFGLFILNSQSALSSLGDSRLQLFENLHSKGNQRANDKNIDRWHADEQTDGSLFRRFVVAERI